MAFTYFKPDIWSAKILQERDRFCVGVNLCDRSYESEVRNYGQSIKLNWVKRPTVGTYTVGENITTAETLDDTSATLNINQMKYVHFIVDDVDELQSKPDLMAACMNEASAAIAEDADDYVYGFYSTVATTSTTNYIANTSVTSANILSVVSEAARLLYEQNVPSNEELYLEVSPAVFQKLWLAKVIHSTPNTEAFANGFRGYVDNFKVYMTNGIKKTVDASNSTTTHHCIARTKKAIAFAGQMTKTEAYRPDLQFADAVKSLHVYGGVVQRPKELIRLDLITAAETTI
jgi:hypothetical protein